MCVCLYIHRLHLLQVLVYDDLPVTDLVWVPGEAHQVPKGAIIAGTALDLSPVYVNRFEEYPAYYDPRETYAVYEYYGMQQAEAWEVLCVRYSKSILIKSSQYELFVPAY